MFRRLFVACVAGMMILSAGEGLAKGSSKAGRVILTGVLARGASAPAGAKGAAKYDESSSRRNLKVEGENLRVLNGRLAVISVNGRTVGSTTIALGRVGVELSTQRGQSVPVLSTGATVEVKVDGVTILSGSLR